MVSHLLGCPCFIEIRTQNSTEKDHVENDDTVEEEDEHENGKLFSPCNPFFLSLESSKMMEESRRYPPGHGPDNSHPHPSLSRLLFNMNIFTKLRIHILEQRFVYNLLVIVMELMRVTLKHSLLVTTLSSPFTLLLHRSGLRELRVLGFEFSVGVLADPDSVSTDVDLRSRSDVVSSP